MANKDMIFGYHPVGAPHADANSREVGKPSRNAAQPVQGAGYVNDDLGADGLRKGWGFKVGTWNVDSLTGRVVK